MAKYQIESGSLRMVVRADDAHKAALWAVHRALQQVLPIYDDESLSAEQREYCAVRRGCAVMGEVLRLREVDDQGAATHYRFATFDLVTEWNRLMVALSRLEQQLLAAV